ncbi:MAG: hypothetical protein IJU75_03485 [Clostridia bacterium]|nr:hypothetical protein [Clostridia bacterium]
MKIVVRNVRTPVRATDGDACAIAAKRLSPYLGGVGKYSSYVCKKSVDARRREPVIVRSVIIETDETLPEQVLRSADAAAIAEHADPVMTAAEGDEIPSGRPVVVGFGPCGMFAALALAERGYRPIVIERGDPVSVRSFRVAEFMKTGVLDADSNVQFGAGGAGTFSDGKLVTRINDENVEYVLRRFVGFGAPAEILKNAKPHVGTDRLLRVVSEIDERIRELGGEIKYRTRFDGIKTDPVGRAAAVFTTEGEIPCGQVVLAVGNGARDTFSRLIRAGFDVVPKPFSVGVRIEHLQEKTDRAMFGDYAGDPRIGHAEYAFSERVGEDCVYTFCMCPGGEVIAAASEQGGVVTNGMSRYLRNGRNGNAALVVNVSPDDPVGFQRSLETAAFRMGGGDFLAPAETVGSFLRKTGGSLRDVEPTYMGGKVTFSHLSQLFPDRINRMLRLGLEAFDRKLNGFADPGAVLTGVETRTSSPYRIVRNEFMTSSVSENVYPAGEGAGYAGGITSAAVDGLRAAVAIIRKYRPF